jgi:hypothetical protein
VQNRKEEGGKISSPEQFFLHDSFRRSTCC